MAPPHTVFAKPDPNLLTRSWLFEEQQLILDRYYAVRSQINALAPSCQLPEELLIKILKAVQPTSRTSLVVGMQWIQATQVCRHWREIALQTPELWSNVVPSCEDTV